ncbi:hypothetical protein CL622_03570 [archaeon]|nr:hypothetical protein [archaeon]
MNEPIEFNWQRYVDEGHHTTWYQYLSLDPIECATDNVYSYKWFSDWGSTEMHEKRRIANAVAVSVCECFAVGAEL